jgi:hypothetical protein
MVSGDRRRDMQAAEECRLGDESGMPPSESCRRRDEKNTQAHVHNIRKIAERPSWRGLADEPAHEAEIGKREGSRQNAPAKPLA